MQGLSKHTKEIFAEICSLECIKEYTLTGGTALSLQIAHRLSEDLDFCKWKDGKTTQVDWPGIRDEITEKLSGSLKINVLDFNQVDFVVDGMVKLSFYSNQILKSPVENTNHISGNMYIADIRSIGAMKIEVMGRRTNFRDYYDIYSILKYGIPLSEIVGKTLKYSRNQINSKSIFTMLQDGDRFKMEKGFNNLSPKYNVSEKDIELYIKSTILKENELKREMLPPKK